MHITPTALVEAFLYLPKPQEALQGKISGSVRRPPVVPMKSFPKMREIFWIQAAGASSGGVALIRSQGQESPVSLQRKHLSPWPTPFRHRTASQVTRLRRG